MVSKLESNEEKSNDKNDKKKIRVLRQRKAKVRLELHRVTFGKTVMEHCENTTHLRTVPTSLKSYRTESSRLFPILYYL